MPNPEGFENPYDGDPVGFHLDGAWITRSISRVIRFDKDPLCDHLEVRGDPYPMAYTMDEDGFATLEALGWSTHRYQAASHQLMEFIVELHLENQPLELLKWHSENP